jgi:hypothetical protein
MGNCDTHIRFSSQQFGVFCELVEQICEPLCLTWWIELVS